MLNQKTISALAEHGDVWCLDLAALPRFMADGEKQAAMPRLPKVNGSVAVIPLYGLITKRGSWMSDGTDRVSRTLDAAMASKAVGGVVLDVDSPGGTSYGLMEFSDKLFSLRGTKPIVAVANSLMASAAYWAGTSADQVIAAPSADVGSVGVWSLHVDYSRMMEEQGITPTFVSAGKYKVEGHPYEPLSDEARAELQRGVDEVYDQFVTALARNRNVPKATVRSDFGEGRVLSAERAKAAGMVDRVSSMEDVLAAMGAAVESGGRRTEQDVERMLLAAWNAEPVEPQGEHVDARRRRRERERSRG